jgi:molybdopterin converting factor subunit 1
MDVEIRLFATLKDRAGQARIRIDLPESASVQQMLQTIAEDFPSLAEALETSLVAVNQAFASADTALHADDEIAIFPPVSGGSQDFPYPTYFAITADELDLNAIQTRLTQPDIGAIVSFTGSVRGQTERKGLPNQTLYLEYESYASMAEVKMLQIAREIWDRWPLVKGIAIVQRVGRLDIGEITTFVACAASHRDQGVFDAARYGIDRLKEIVPVWKKEVGSDQSLWVEGDYRPTEADNR